MVPPGTIPLFPAAPGPLLSLPKFAPGPPGPLSPGAPHGQALTVSPETDRRTLLAATAAAVWRVQGRQAGARGRAPGRVGATPLLRGCRSSSDSPSGTCRERQTGEPRRSLSPPAGAHSLYGQPGAAPSRRWTNLARRAPPPSSCEAWPRPSSCEVRSHAPGAVQRPWPRPTPNRSSSSATEPRPSPRG